MEKGIIISLLFGLFVGLVGGLSFPCATPGFFRSEDRKWCFHLSSLQQDFASASVFCQAYDATLLTIETEEKQKQIEQILNSTFGLEPGLAYIGATNILADKTWTWYQSTEMTYTNWGTDQPNMNKTRYTCAGMKLGRFGYTWDTINCYREDRYICQKQYSDEESVV